MKARTQVLKLQAEVDKAATRHAASSVKILETKRKMEAAKSSARAASRLRDDRDIARCYAAEVHSKLRNLTKEQKKAMTAVAGRNAQHECELPRHVPASWPNRIETSS